MPRFFIPTENLSENTLKITGNDARHIARSLRMAVGDEVTVCDMQGRTHTCRLTKIRDEECELDIISSEAKNTEPPTRITLFMGYPKGDKLETVVQKAVELGCAKIVPFESSRCVKRPKADRQQKQTERLCRIAEEAAKQCGRAILPEVCEPVSFSLALELAKESELSLFCYEGDGAKSLKAALPESTPNSISVFVGCEGGFSEDEANEAVSCGLTLVNLGPRILRCETAPTYALTAISFRYEL